MRFYVPLLLSWFWLVFVPNAGAQKSSRKPTTQEDRAMLMQNDYEALTGRWQLVKSIVDGRLVPEDEVRKTILIADHDTFRFPADAKVGTAPQGRFTLNPTKTPKQVDSIALTGPHKGQVTHGIYEILDASNKRACWSLPGAPRPTDFSSTPGSGRTVQYWRLISKEPGD